MNSAVDLSNYRLICVGCGKMGAALVRGIVESGLISPEQVLGIDRSAQKLQVLSDSLGIHIHDSTSPRGLISPIDEEVDTLRRHFLFAVKPEVIEAVISTMSEHFQEGDRVISVAAGVTLKRLCEAAGPGVSIVRAMPNTPARVRAGVTGIMTQGAGRFQDVEELFESVGEVVVLEKEADFHGLTALSGSGPAYLFMAMEALIDGGVCTGLSREVARKLVVSTVEGAGRLAREEGKDPALLRGEVTSPAGTTIEALVTLEDHGFRSALVNAVRSAAGRSKEMSTFGED